MARKKKSALKQGPVTEPVVEEKITISGADFVAKIEENENIGVTEDGIAIHPDNFPKEETKSIEYDSDYVDTFEGEHKLVEKISPHDELVLEVKPPRTMESLSKAEMRSFQRTGIMPK